MANIKYVGDGDVFLIHGGGKSYSDMAAKFCRTEKDIRDLIASNQSKKLISDLINSRHTAALEFDDFIFGVQGYARVTEVQLVRKRHASYMIKSGRVEEDGKRSFDIVLPKAIMGHSTKVLLDQEKLYIKAQSPSGKLWSYTIQDLLNTFSDAPKAVEIVYELDTATILSFIEDWYSTGVMCGYKEEELRYIKPQATEFKAAIKMNATALREWAEIRMCNRAQSEIRDLCTKMVSLAKKAAPELMAGVGPSCTVLGYCPETEQCSQLRGTVPTKSDVEALITKYWHTGGANDN